MPADEFTIIDALRARNEKVARAVLVDVAGGSTRRIGASLWVAADGSTRGGITVGGCIEAWVTQRAREVLARGAPGSFRIALGGEGEIDPQLGCAGTAEVQIEIVNFADPNDPILTTYGTLRSACADGQAAVVAFSRGGARVVLTTRRTSDARLPASVTLAARGMLTSGTPGVRRVDDGGGWLLELFHPSPLLMVFGAGAVALALTSLATATAFRVWTVHGRAEQLTVDRFPDAERLVVVDPHYSVEALPWGRDTYAVVTSHNPGDEVAVISHAVYTEVAFVGFVASRERGARVLRYLADIGVSEEKLARVRVPVGLEIGAESPDEIAISILAELVAVRSARHSALSRMSRPRLSGELVPA